MRFAILNKLTKSVLPAAVLSASLLLSLYFLSGATDDSATFNQQYVGLLIANIIGLILLLAYIARNAYRLYQQYKLGVPGSRLTTRLLSMFVIISVIPMSVVYYFSLDFLHRGIDTWFDVQIETALDDALELSRTSLDSQMRTLLRNTNEYADRIAAQPDASAILTLDDLRISSGAKEMTLYEDGNIIATSSSNALVVLVPQRPSEQVFGYIRRGEQYAGLDPVPGEGLSMRVVVRVPANKTGFGVRALQALYPVAKRQTDLADSVQQAFAKYDELVYLRKPLKFSFTLTLTLVLLLAILSAVWAAFFTSRRLVAPISDLVEGTSAVASGDYSKRLPLPENDELGFLVQSFNTMTRRIERARNEARSSQLKIEEQRTYLEGVLGNLSSGVITLDAEYTLRSSNAAADGILAVDVNAVVDEPFAELSKRYPRLSHFVDAVTPHLGSLQEWREEIILFSAGGRQILVCRGVILPGSVSGAGDLMMVFEDVTTLVQAQRDSAWGEVARRLAHEIKNPLTPIQLSAERLRHKLLSTLDDDSAHVLDRSTSTIVQQVESMKAMVNAFAEYARVPQMNLQALDLNNLIESVLELYRNDESALKMDVKFDSSTPQIEADAGRMRQLLHNLIKNAIEAMEDTASPILTVSTRCMQEATCRFVEIRVEDNGEGIPEDHRAELFEPYVTDKPKGTGLGLAIVKKIVEEHGGMVMADNNADRGAWFAIRLPVLSSNTAASSVNEKDKQEDVQV